MLPTFVAALLFLSGAVQCTQYLSSSTHDYDLTIGQTINVTIKLSTNSTDRGGGAIVDSWTKYGDVVGVSPKTFNISPSDPVVVTLTGKSPGHDVAFFNSTTPDINFDEAFIRLTVARSSQLATISFVVGWVYFAAWSISFYPQVYENWRRKSVVGLNFDFLALNLVGFILYSVFNCALYWSPEIEAEYHHRYPRGLNPVQLNDIVFSLHAAVVTVLTVLQCFMYERGGQRVSVIAQSILGLFAVTLIISIILVLTVVIHWLDFFYICSYIKLAITLIKYVPQAFMNYRRKSTIGWSIGNVVLDFTGGILSMLQMLVNADNYDDWASIFGDPTKFGLGLFSVLFDIFFLIQHYILYRNSSKTVYVFE